MTIIEQIETVRASLGISRRQLAIKSGIRPSTLQSMLERKNELSLDVVERLIATLNNFSKTEVYLSRFQGSPTIFIKEPTNTMAQMVGTTPQKEFHDGMPQISPIKNLCLQEIGTLLDALNDTGRQVAVERIRELTEIKRYTT